MAELSKPLATWESVITEDRKADDAVNHTNHYTGGSVECIDAMIETQGVDAVMDYCVCNAFKYLWRHRNKGGVEDIKKSHWYLKKYLELLPKCNK